LATGSADKSTKIWDIETGKELLTLKGGDGSPSSVAWSPDGRQLAMGSGGVLKVWNMPAAKELLTLVNKENVRSVAWSHDGTRLAAGMGSALKLWNALNGEELLNLSSDADLNSLAWASGDTRLVAGFLDGTVRIFAMDVQDLVALARQRVTRDLTQEECRKYLHMVRCSPIARSY
jgi:WD40 repeat protein